jgi:hypothetical protein
MSPEECTKYCELLKQVDTQLEKVYDALGSGDTETLRAWAEQIKRGIPYEPTKEAIEEAARWLEEKEREDNE